MKRYKCILAVAVSGVFVALGCAPPRVVKYQVKKSYIRALSGGQMRKATDEKQEWDTATYKYGIEKKKLKLRRIDYKLARLWYKAAKVQLKRMRLALELKNKKVPVDLAPGAYQQALNDKELAKKNLAYRALLYKHYKLRVKMLYWQQYHRKAQYFEEVVRAMHKAGHSAASKYRKFKYARQSAKLKLKMAAAQEKVENAEGKIKALKGEVEDAWGPSLKREPPPQPAPAPQPQPRPQPAPTPRPAEKKPAARPAAPAR